MSGLCRLEVGMEDWGGDAATVWGSLVPIVEVAILDVDVPCVASMTGSVDQLVEGRQSNKSEKMMPTK